MSNIFVLLVNKSSFKINNTVKLRHVYKTKTSKIQLRIKVRSMIHFIYACIMYRKKLSSICLQNHGIQIAYIKVAFNIYKSIE